MSEVNHRTHEKLKKACKIGDFFGLAKDWKRPTEEIMKEAKEGWKD